MKKLIFHLTCLFIFIVSSAQAIDETTPVSELTGYEQQYYLQIFDYVMDGKEETKSFRWGSRSGTGEIIAGKEYMSKSQTVCRDFTETFKINGREGTAKGSGCKRIGNDGWCRVTEGNVHSCALEKSTDESGQLIDNTSDFIGKAAGWLR